MLFKLKKIDLWRKNQAASGSVLIVMGLIRVFRRTGRTVLPRVGNTCRKAQRIPWNPSAVFFSGNADKCFGFYIVIYSLWIVIFKIYCIRLTYGAHTVHKKGILFQHRGKDCTVLQAKNPQWNYPLLNFFNRLGSTRYYNVLHENIALASFFNSHSIVRILPLVRKSFQKTVQTMSNNIRYS